MRAEALAIPLLLAACGGAGPVAGGPPLVRLDDLDGGERFGAGPDATRQTPSGVRFAFRGRPDGEVRSALVFARYAPTAPVAIRLNGVPIGTVPRSDSLRTAQEVRLPAELLRGDDELAFVPEGEGAWAVGEVRVAVDPLPPCAAGECADRARSLFERGERLHADRAVAAENLARAAALLREALLHVERVEPPPPLRGRIAGLLAEAAAELDGRCRSLRFAAVGQVHLGRWDEARATARAMEARFPSADHPCHRTARRLLERLEEAP